MFGEEVWPEDFYTHNKGQKVSLFSLKIIVGSFVEQLHFIEICIFFINHKQGWISKVLLFHMLFVHTDLAFIL